MSMQDDLRLRSLDIHWPEGFNPEHADLFACSTLFIRASAAKIWDLLTRACAWPEWNPNTKSVRLHDGGEVLALGASFAWTVGGLDIESRISEFEPQSRLAWLGYEPGGVPQFCHAWNVVEGDDGCLVISEESAHGPLPLQFRQMDEDGLHLANEMWLAVLKWKAQSK